MRLSEYIAAALFLAATFCSAIGWKFLFVAFISAFMVVLLYAGFSQFKE